MANQVNNQRHKYHALTAQYHSDSEDDTTKVVKTSVTVTNSSFQNYTHPDVHNRQTTRYRHEPIILLISPKCSPEIKRAWIDEISKTANFRTAVA